MYLLHSIFALSYIVGSSWAGIHEIWWNITYVENANPDGLFPRRVIGINGTWPPPPIEVNSTDQLIVHAFNSIDQPATLHHHGMFFNSTSWFDGAMGLSQCGIPPGQPFTYTVPVAKSRQIGTYWVHSHAKGQYVDGLRAPFVIHASKETYAYDGEFTVVLGDWYHQQHDDLLQKYISPYNPNGNEPVPDSGLIYFSSNGTYLPPKSGTPDIVASGVGFNENATIEFKPNLTYRLRVVNTGTIAPFAFWIDGHNMTIIEVDGTDVLETEPIHTLKVAVAQRYSVLVKAREDFFNWAIHANIDTSMFPKNSMTNPNVTATITYNPDFPLGPQETRDSYPEVDDISLVPVIPIPAAKSTKTIVLLANFSVMTDGTNRAMFNNVSFTAPLVPSILSELTTGVNASIPATYGPSTFILDPFDVVDLVVQNPGGGSHPFHIHGHQVQIMQRSADFTNSPPIDENQNNPMRRDTVQIPGKAGATLRFVADNPGAWFFHCHIEWHLEAGLAIKLIEAPLLIQKDTNAPTKDLQKLCVGDNLPISGNAAGHVTPTDYSGWTLAPEPTWFTTTTGPISTFTLTLPTPITTVTASGSSSSETAPIIISTATAPAPVFSSTATAPIFSSTATAPIFSSTATAPRFSSTFT